ncbi:MAG: type III-B CRISPR-associated protein Cas10/Cmr2, partial [Nitrososphaerota archaeon]
MNSMNYFTEKLKAYFHDSFDKCFDIPGHEKRAQKYANLINIGNIKEAEGADRIASCMERSLLPKEKLIQEFNEIRHPLCEGVLKVDLKPPLDKILIIYDEIKNKIPNEENDKFLYIWRNIQKIAFKTLKDEEVAKYISILPADTRIPDHSIWEHLKITSAINAFWDGENRILYQNNSLLLFTIGPVQSFISQARKTIDFFMGSYILSYLTFIAMKVVIEKYGPTSIIYPDLYKQTLMDNFLIKKGIKIEDIFDEKTLLNPTIPNRFVSILPETEETKIKEIAQLIEINIKETLNEAINIIFKELNIRPNEKHKNKIDSQLSEFPEIYWTSIPWKVNGRDIVLNDLSLFFKNDFLKGWEDLWGFAQKRGEYLPNIGFLYEVIYSALEKSMGGRKKLREFGQFKIEEKGRKCSVCGERDVIFFNEKENKKKFITYNDIFIDLTDEIEKGVIPLRFLANGEGLCSICFLKRTFEIYLKNIESNIFENFFFPSIAEIASSDFKESAILKASKEYFDYQEEIKNTFGIKFYTQKVMPLPKLKFLFEEKINLDGEWFYEENLRREYFEKEFGISLTEEQIQILKEKYKR